MRKISSQNTPVKAPPGPLQESVAEKMKRLARERIKAQSANINPSKPPYKISSMREIRARPRVGITAISLFSGCGGTDLGLEMAGFTTLWANEFMPKARSSFAVNHPGVKIDPRSIREVQSSEILSAINMKKGELDILVGSPPCFAAGTTVVTARGLIPIEQVKYGDRVLTHLGRWQKVCGTMSRWSPTVLVDNYIECTPDHRFLAKGHDTKGKGTREANCLSEAIWIKAENLHNKFLATPHTIESIPLAEPPDGFVYDCAFWYTVGLWLGNGWVRITEGDGTRIKKPRSEVVICFHKDKTDKFKLEMEKMGHHIAICEQKTANRLYLYSKAFAFWLVENFSKYAHLKTMPGYVFGMREDWRKSLFQGYLDTDGCVDKKNKISFTTTSPCLRDGMVLLATSLGYDFTIQHSHKAGMSRIKGRDVLTKDSWMVRISQKGRYTQDDENLRWKKLRRTVTKKEDLTQVYDITVENDHSFVAGGKVVHNCQSFSTSGLREDGWGKEHKYSKQTSQRSDDLFEEFIRIVGGLMPKVFVAENVSGMIKGESRGYFNEVMLKMKNLGYRVEARIIDAQWVGVPQARERLIFVGVRNDLNKDPVYPTPLSYRYGVGEAIADCPPPKEGDNTECLWLQPRTAGLQRWRICKPGQSFDETMKGSKPKQFTHKKVNPLKPSFTLHAKTPDTYHWEFPRTFSVAEIKRIGGFPDDFILTGSYYDKYERIGRAVPPLMAEAVAKTIATEIFGVNYNAKNAS